MQQQKRMEQVYPRCGWIYIISNPGWGEGIYKIGRTGNWEKRKKSYNSCQLEPIKLIRLFLCKNMYSIEDHLKHEIRPYLIGTKHEYVRMDLNKLLKIAETLIIHDPILSEYFKRKIYTLYDHSCQLYSTQFLTDQKQTTCAVQETSTTLAPGQWFSGMLETIPEPKVYSKHHATSTPSETSTPRLTKVEPLERGIYYDSVRKIYKVDITRCQKRHQKYFFVSSWGVQAKTLAIAWKQRIIQQVKANPPVRTIKSSHCKGVYYDGLRKCWTACIQLESVRKKKEFSLVKLGDQQAMKEAAKWRKEMEQKKMMGRVCSE